MELVGISQTIMEMSVLHFVSIHFLPLRIWPRRIDAVNWGGSPVNGMREEPSYLNRRSHFRTSINSPWIVVDRGRKRRWK